MEFDPSLAGEKSSATSPLESVTMPPKLRQQAEQLRQQLRELHQGQPEALQAEQLRLCAAKLGEAVAIFASLRLHTPLRRLQAQQALAEQLRLCSSEVDRLADAIDEAALQLQNVHGNYLRDAFGVSALAL